MSKPSASALRSRLAPIAIAVLLATSGHVSLAGGNPVEAADTTPHKLSPIEIKRHQLELEVLAGKSAASYDLALSYFDPFEIVRSSDGRIIDDSPDEVGEDDLLEARRRFGQLAPTNPSAATALAIMLETGKGGPRDARRARAIYETASIDRAQWNLGAMRELGLGGPVDLKGARAAYARGGELGGIEPLYAQARMTRSGLGGTADPKEARRLLTAVVKYCHADGANDLADMEAEGEGGPRDVELAAQHYIHAAQCRNRYFSEPRLLTDPMGIDLDVRIEVQRLLRMYFSYRGPVDGAINDVETVVLLLSLADQRPGGEMMPDFPPAATGPDPARPVAVNGSAR
jgi:TPR repeat protein